MAMEGQQRAAAMNLKGSVTFETADLETLQGQYDTTTCIDVLIHYPTEKMDAMVGHYYYNLLLLLLFKKKWTRWLGHLCSVSKKR
jgi:cyclopropane fatty-acyl-phospholipid synthase-like methyltransferase